MAVKPLPYARVCTYGIAADPFAANASNWVVTNCLFADSDGYVRPNVADGTTYKICSSMTGYTGICDVRYIPPLNTQTFTYDLAPVVSSTPWTYFSSTCSLQYNDTRNCVATATSYATIYSIQILFQNSAGTYQMYNATNSMSAQLAYTLDATATNWTNITLYINGIAISQIYHVNYSYNPSVVINWNHATGGTTFMEKLQSKPQYLYLAYVIFLFLGALIGFVTDKYYNGYGVYGTGAWWIVIGIGGFPLFIIAALPIVFYFIIDNIIPLLK